MKRTKDGIGLLGLQTSQTIDLERFIPAPFPKNSHL